MPKDSPAVRWLDAAEQELRLRAHAALDPAGLACLLEVARREGAGLCITLATMPSARHHPLLTRALLTNLTPDVSPGSAKGIDVCCWPDQSLFGDCSRLRPEALQGIEKLLCRLAPLTEPISLRWGTEASADTLLRAGWAITGTRRASDAGTRFAQRFGASVARAGMLLVHGGANGIDAAAAEGAVAQGGAQLVILGGGWEHSIANHSLKEFFGRWVVVTALPGAAPPTAHRLVARNRLIARSANALAIGEVAGTTGGAWHTLRFAREAGRPCYVPPEPLPGPALLFAGMERLPENLDPGWLRARGAASDADAQRSPSTSQDDLFG